MPCHESDLTSLSAEGRFHQIFDQNSSQEDVFENTTKPIVNSVLHGFNGTIFAYGQTGSGKTYSMTGCSDEYENRGIIPRCVQEVFQFTNKSPDQFTIFISYMEIYNEIGYDLLNPKHQATKLEELPRVTLLDDGKGEAHLRNLFMLPVLTEQEAMRLLFLGDTNRTIAETPMNDYSSRSHCIFTIYITRTENERKIRKSKLNLVDLAGSERIYKTNISGATLTEAKNINLSLHYLEQVILALSQSKRSHIPFRNSMMTYMLRDSLSGNSITAMLATLSIKAINLEETVTTCNFSQRVALVNTDAMINEVFDPQEEIDYLRNEVTNLRQKLTTPSNIPTTGQKVLSESEIEFCEAFTMEYIETGIWTNNVILNLEQCMKCFQVFRAQIVNNKSDIQKKSTQDVPVDEYTCTKNDIVEKFKEIIKQKDEEIEILTQLLEAYDLSKSRSGVESSEVPTNSINVTPRSKQSEESEVDEVELTANEEALFDEFLNEKNNSTHLNNLTSHIESKCQSAEQITAFVESCQQNILRLRRKLEMGFGVTDSAYVTQIQNSLKSQQDVYAKSIENLKNVRDETEFLEHSLKQERIRLEQKFRNRRKKSSNKHIHSTLKSKSESGIFTRINESLKNIERKFSAKVKNQAKTLSPKKSESEAHISVYTEKWSTSSNLTGQFANANSYSKLDSNSFTDLPSKKSSCENMQPKQEVSTKKPISRNVSTARKAVPSTRKSPDKWDALRIQHNELYSSYDDPPGNISRLVTLTPHSKTIPTNTEQTMSANVKKEQIKSITKLPEQTPKLDLFCNNYLRIGKSTNGNYTKDAEAPRNTAIVRNSIKINSVEDVHATHCKDLEPELKHTKETLSDNDSDSLFERKIQSYLKMVPINPRRDTQLQNTPTAMGNNIYNTPTSSTNSTRLKDRAYKRKIENPNASIDFLRQLNRVVNGKADDQNNTTFPKSNLTDSRYVSMSTESMPNDVKFKASSHDRNDERTCPQRNDNDDRTRPQQNDLSKRRIVEQNYRYNKQVTFSEQIESNRYEEAVSDYQYNDILQEEHIPEKDITISHRSSSSEEQQQPEQQLNKAVDDQTLFIDDDSTDFIAFMRTIPLTGDADVDEEIVKFYRTKFTHE